MTLEELPPVLVLHLKRFVFEKTGGCQKLVKNIDYPVDLEISKGAHFIFMKLFLAAIQFSLVNILIFEIRNWMSTSNNDCL